jgi:hypothetical protein
MSLGVGSIGSKSSKIVSRKISGSTNYQILAVVALFFLT